MKVGIIGPSKLNEKNKDIILKVIKQVINHEIILTPDKGSVSEYFAKEYLRAGGKKLYEVVPLEDNEFGYDWINLKLGKIIDCGTWRNQPEKLNEECDVIICLGYSAGGLIEMGYSKWFNPKPIYIIKELISKKLPKEIEKSLDLRYISYKNLKIKNEQ